MGTAGPVGLSPQVKAAREQLQNQLTAAKNSKRKLEGQLTTAKNDFKTNQHNPLLVRAKITIASLTDNVATITYDGDLGSLSASSTAGYFGHVFIYGLPEAFKGDFKLRSFNSNTLTYSVKAPNSPYITDPEYGYVYANGFFSVNLSDPVTALGKSWKKITDLEAKIDSKQKQIDLINAQLVQTAHGNMPTPTGTTTTTKIDLPKVDANQVTYNIPSVTESYFRTNTYLADDYFITEGGGPKKVKEAVDLWNSTGTHKGMIQSFIVPKSGVRNGVGGPLATMDASDWTRQFPNQGRYAYQFQYNPGMVNMSYSGAPNVDLGLVMSGLNTLPLMGTSNSTSTVDFDIVINRMADMKYLMSKSGQNANLASGYVYGRDVPAADLELIRKKGTMYDLEFLLQTLLGYTANSKLRGVTADLGYIGGFPVELHLGKSLRYVVIIDSISLSHTIFTKDMIPVYTNVHISAGRLIDTGFNTMLSQNSAYTASSSTQTGR